ncbi:hypothetical protein LTR08_003552 [Meristemomyces frigidus]|nr:hypothetical protein LTR08_003552 [Meristemomyces frigidus]
MCEGSSTGVLGEVDKLKGKENYKSWKLVMESSLIVSAWKIESKNWEKSDAKARSDIFITVLPHIVEYLGEIPTAAGIWAQLKADHKASGAANRMDKSNEWEQLRYGGK